MTIAAARFDGKRRLGWAPRFIVFLALFAFALQSYVTQTHVHDGMPDDGGIAKIATGALPHHKIPLNNSPASCPFCQTVALAGAFISPATLALYLPLAWVKSAAHVVAARAELGAISHDWRSRAPPRP